MSGAKPKDAATVDRGSADATLRAHEAAARAREPPSDRYTRLGLLGEGGMGVVLRCRDDRSGRDVALKLAHDPKGGEARFLREACVQAQLDHPGIVTLYDLHVPTRFVTPEGVPREGGEQAREHPFFTMRLVEGITVDEITRRARAGDAVIVREHTRHRLLMAFLHVCLAVDFAHARGILHRDLKPTNIMMGEFGEVYVLDWGVAKAADATREPTSPDELPVGPAGSMTQAGHTVGTITYMSPEQSRAEQLDARSDVFALGATLFEILALEPLFEDAAALRRWGSERVAYDARPSLRARGEPVPAELDAICVRATAYDREERFPSARALHDAIEAFLSADRDAADRRRLADAHCARASDAAARTLTGADADDGSRAEALGELGRALAFAPDDAASQSLLVDLLTHRPKEVPREVEQALAAANEERLRKMQRTALGIYSIAWLLLFPIVVLSAGVRRPLDALIPPAAWTLACATILVTYKYRIYDTRINYAHMMVMFAVAATSLVVGPHLMVPALAAATIMGHMLVATRRQRLGSVLLGCLAIGVPATLAWIGVSHVNSFVLDGMTVDGAIKTSPTVFYVGLTICHLAAILSAGLFAARFRDMLEAAVMKNALFAWQVEHLVPHTEEPAVKARAAPKPAAAPAAFASGARDSILATPIAAGTERYERVGTIEAAHQGEVSIGRFCDRYLGRDVAMYVSKAERGSAPAARFVARALARAKLEHPGIVPVYDVGDGRDGAPFFTEKLVRGDSLDVVLRARAEELGAAVSAYSLHRLLGALNQACLAVAYAHARGVHHGALAASSILLGPFGELYVMGWGKDVPADGVATGRAESDVRALGTILREILAVHRSVPPELSEIADRTTKDAAEGGLVSARALYGAIEAFLAGDRDAVLRKRLAASHLERARSASARALASDEEGAAASSRVEALREIGRAVALSPGAESVEVLVALLTTPPARPPPEIVASVEEMRRARAQRTARVSAFFIGLLLVIYPLIGLLIHVRNFVAFVAVGLGWLAAEVTLVIAIVRKASRTPWPMMAMMLAVGMTSAVSGPFIIVPASATLLTIAFILTVDARWRRTTVLLAALAILAPTMLQALGVYRFYEFAGDTIIVRGAFHPDPTGAFLSVTFHHLLMVLFGAEYAVRFRDTLDGVETERLFSTWQLSKLVATPLP